MKKFQHSRFEDRASDVDRRGDGRIGTSQFAELEVTAGRYVVELLNLSEQGACVRLSNMPVPSIDSPVALVLCDGDVAIGTVRWLGRDTAGLEFTQTIATPQAKTELEHLGRAMFSRVLALQSKRRSSS